MFEDSLFSSQARSMSARTRWTVAASIAVQALTFAAAIVFPLLWPATLPVVSAAPRALSLTLRHPEIKPVPVRPTPTHVTSPSALHAPSTSVAITESARHGGSIARPAAPSFGDEPPALALGGAMSFALGSGPGLGGPGTAPLHVVAAALHTASPVRISSGVSAGLLLAPIRPAYPRIAIAARQEGTVTMTATIDRTGRIVGLQVLGGPEMLRTAAVDAVQAARYRPYTLNGEATEVVTTIKVTFLLSSSS